MKNNVKIIGIIALAAVIGFTFAACDNGTTDDGGGGGLAAPTGLTATALSSTEIKLSWNAVSGATGYKVYNSLNPSSEFGLLTTETSTGITNYNLTPNTTVYYKVSAFNASGESAMSNVVSATTLGGGNAIDGTYNSADGSRIVMNNGSFTLYDNNVEIAKGTYTASGSAITMTFTEYKGSFLNENGLDFVGLTAAQWYNQQQLRTAIINYFVSLGISQAQAEASYNEEVRESVNEMYSSFTVSKSGNTLIIIIFGEPTTFNGGNQTNYSLDGVWLMEDHTVITINGSTGVFTSINLSELSPLSQSAVNKGYVKVGDQFFRNLTKTSDLTWTGQQLGINYNTSAPNIATGTYWGNFTITMNANGQTFTDGGATYTRVNTSLNGVWLMEDHTVVTINGSTGVFTSINLSELSPLSQSAVNKGYVKVGDQFFRNLTKTGDLTWTGQQLGINYNTSAPNVATGIYWGNFTITMNANGQTFTDGGATYTRQ